MSSSSDSLCSKTSIAVSLISTNSSDASPRTFAGQALDLLEHRKEFVLKHVILDTNIIEKPNLTSIIGHYSVPEESLDNVDIENILDDNINNKSETVENKDLLSNILQESNS